MQQTPTPNTIANRLEFARVTQADHVAEATRLERAAEAAQHDFEQTPTPKAFADAQVAAQLARNARALQRQHDTDVVAPLAEEQAQAAHRARVAELRREFDPARIERAHERMESAIRTFLREIDGAAAELVGELERRLDREQDVLAAGLFDSRRFKDHIAAIHERLANERDAFNANETRFVSFSYGGTPNPRELVFTMRRPVAINRRIG